MSVTGLRNSLIRYPLATPTITCKNRLISTVIAFKIAWLRHFWPDFKLKNRPGGIPGLNGRQMYYAWLLTVWLVSLYITHQIICFREIDLYFAQAQWEFYIFSQELHLATRRGNLVQVKSIIKAGVDINSRTAQVSAWMKSEAVTNSDCTAICFFPDLVCLWDMKLKDLCVAPKHADNSCQEQTDTCVEMPGIIISLCWCQEARAFCAARNPRL